MGNVCLWLIVIADNLVEGGKRKAASNISSPATPTTSSSSSTTPTRRSESPRAATGVPSGKESLLSLLKRPVPCQARPEICHCETWWPAAFFTPFSQRPRAECTVSCWRGGAWLWRGSFLITELAPPHRPPLHLPAEPSRVPGRKAGSDGKHPSSACVGSGREEM